jgi:hypothetical protein
MAKRSSKPRDLNSLAASIVREATEDGPPQESKPERRNPAEAARRGGLKGGKARAEKLTPQQRSDAARRAAQARWSR